MSARPASIRGERLLLALVLAAALGLRLAYLFAARANPYFEAPAVDAGFWVEWGRAVAAGERFVEGPYPKGPLYAWLLGGLFAASGGSLVFARLVQALFGSATVLLVHLVGRRVAGPRAGLCGAALAALAWVPIYYDAELVRASPTAAMSTLVLWLALRLDERPGWGRALATGVALGLTALLRAQVLAFAPVLVAWLAWKGPCLGWRGPCLVWKGPCPVWKGQRWAAAALVLVGTALPILPVSAHNLLVGGDAVLISPEGGTLLWNSNHPAADGVTGVPPGVRSGFREQVADQHAQAEAALGRALRPSEASRYWAGRALEHAREHPGDVLALLGRKLALFWSDWEYGNPEEPWFFARRYAPWTAWLVGFAPLAGLGLVGALRFGRARAGALVVGFVLTYMATVVLFLIAARYRAPALPALAVLAGCGVETIARAWEDRRRGRALAWGALALAALLATKAAPAPRAAARANGLWWLGLAELQAERPARALALFDEARAERADFGYLESARALALVALGRVGEARAAFARALELDPLAADTLASAAALERQAGDAARAEALARRAAELAPSAPDPWYTLGRIALERGAPSEARADFGEALARDPLHANAGYGFALLALEAGDAAAAAEVLERLLSAARPLPAELRRRAEELFERARSGR